MRWTFTTVTGDVDWIEDVVSAASAFVTCLAGVLGAIAWIGVPGNAICCIAGVAGAGRHPSAAGLHPVRSASEMVLRVWGSVTHAAASYFPVILEPFSQCPKLSRERSVINPWDASWVPAVT